MKTRILIILALTIFAVSCGQSEESRNKACIKRIDSHMRSVTSGFDKKNRNATLSQRQEAMRTFTHALGSVSKKGCSEEVRFYIKEIRVAINEVIRFLDNQEALMKDRLLGTGQLQAKLGRVKNAMRKLQKLGFGK